jgi:hypothetical protein
MKKIMWVKFGWSDFYRGGPVDGNFSWLNANGGKKKGSRGHEAFNFMPIDGTYYCYVPPQAKGYAPSNDDPEGWTVICLAKHPKRKGIHIVGWYENATLHGDWFPPPAGQRGDAENRGGPYDWSYCISSKSAFFVPPNQRIDPFSDPSVRQAKYSLLDGPDVEINDNKRRVLQLLEDRLPALVAIAVKNPNEITVPDPELDAADPLKGFGTAEHRKKVELAAEDVVIRHFVGRGYDVERVTHMPCGHDFVFTKGKSVLCVEVKGTASETPQFFLTRNEFKKGYLSDPTWHLAMVTSALSASPTLTIYTAKELREAFDMEPYVYLASFLPEPKAD